MRWCVIALAIILAALPAGGVENLDELEAREGRRTTGTMYTGEGASPTYYWQVQAVCYYDTTTGHEVWRITNMPEGELGSHSNEYGSPSVWSANGKYLAIGISTNRMAAYDPGSWSRANAPWFTYTSDYDTLRPAEDYMTRRRRHRLDFGWSPTEPDTAYQMGATSADEDTDHGVVDGWLYKATVSAGNITLAQHLNVGASDGQVHKTMAPDGLRLVVHEYNFNDSLYSVTVRPTAAINATWDIGDNTDRNFDDHWGATSIPADLHNMRLVGNADRGYWIYANLTQSTWWRTRLTGSAADGGPEHTEDTTSPYTWWTGSSTETEIQIANGSYADNADPWCDDGDSETDCSNYWSHPYQYADGTRTLFMDDGEAPSVYDSDEREYVDQFIGSPTTMQHPNWNAWSDHACVWPGVGNYPLFLVNTATSTLINVSYTHEEGSGDDEGCNQSPDGTKLIWGASFLQAGSGWDYNDSFVTTAYYPYPPEVYSVAASGGTVTVTVWWDLAGDNRGYASRGWPDPDSDSPPPPREVATFRLWRCTGTCTASSGSWAPVTTFTHDIWSKYDFADGTWGSGTEADNRWSTTDAVGDGTYYYAVTSLEHSSLESRSLSNIFSITVSGGSGTGAQAVAYPSDPGGDAAFYSTPPNAPTGVTVAHCGTADCSAKSPEPTANGQYLVGWTASSPSTLVRYYNVYAEDGATPTATQANRVASVPAGAGVEHVDWLGNPTGTTEYAITAVDYWGNESTAASVAGSGGTTYLSGVTVSGVTLE